MGRLLAGYRKKSVFYQTLTILSLLSLVTALYFSFFIGQLLLKEQEDKLEELSLLSLRRTVSEVDTVLDSYAAGMAKSLWAQDFVQVMVTGEPTSSVQSARVIDVLSKYTQEDGMVQSVLLYLPISETLFSSKGGYLPMVYSPEAQLLEGLTDTGAPSNSVGDGVNWRVEETPSELFLIVDFAIPNKIGTVFFQLDRDKVLRMIAEETNQAGMSIYVYDSQGHVLAPTRQAIGGNLAPVISQDISGDVVRLGGERYSYTASSLTGWQFIQGNATQRQLNIPYIISLTLPAVVAYILCSMVFSYYITHTVYKPINRLLQITVGGRKNFAAAALPRDVETEVDFLELAYTDSLGESQQYKTLMQSVSDDVIEQLMRNLISHREMDEDYVATTLNGLGLPQLWDAYVCAICGKLVFSEDTDVGGVQTNLYQRSITSIAQEAMPEGIWSCVFFLDRNTVTIALLFPNEKSTTAIKKQVIALMNGVQRRANKLPFDLYLGKGRIYSGLTSLSEAYQDARSEAYYARSRTFEDQPGGEDMTTNDSAWQHYGEKTVHIIATVEKGQPEQGARLLQATIDGVAERFEGDLPKATRCYEGMLDQLVEKLISYHVSNEELEREGLGVVVRTLAQYGDMPSLRNRASEAGEKALQLIAVCGKRKSNRYAEEAKEYIASHYMDSNLSLSDTSDAIGISASYLSSVFSEVVGQHFSSYLSNYRTEQAKRFLTSTSLTVTQIAYRCGFNSIQTFGRVFKKQIGITPGQYRDR